MGVIHDHLWQSGGGVSQRKAFATVEGGVSVDQIVRPGVPMISSPRHADVKSLAFTRDDWLDQGFGGSPGAFQRPSSPGAFPVT